MLSLKNRLASQKEFSAACRFGKIFSSGDIILKIKEKKEGETRFGFSVGVKFSKKAVERNRAKRQLRGIAQEYMGKLKKEVDIMVMIRKGFGGEIIFSQLEKDFKEALKKGKLIN